jgi:hypothetical protein
MDSYGFIITRHVNSITTNKYWNHNIKLLRKLYPLIKIVIIDDNSNYDYIKSDAEYKNIIIIQSEYPKRGELLPYYYYLKYRFFENAVIIHDSVFIHKKINFDKLRGVRVMPLWHFNYMEDIDNTNRLIMYLNNSQIIKNKLSINKEIIPVKKVDSIWYGCFGVQCYINLRFLEFIQEKYNITNLINGVHCRSDRCCLERLFGCIFCTENTNLLLQQSLFGDILKRSIKLNYSYDNYIHDLKIGKLPDYIIKVWTGR